MVTIDTAKCIGCSQCARDCVVHNITIENNIAAVKQNCFLCGHCVAICPVGAVSIPEYCMDEVDDYDPATFKLDPAVFLNAVKFRRSIRDFKPQPLANDLLERIVKAGQYTETAVNFQDVRFIIIQEQLAEFKRLIWDGWYNFTESLRETNPTRYRMFKKYYLLHQKNPANDRLFFNAPAALVIAADIPLNGGLAAANVETMAVAEGLGVMFDGYVTYAIEHNPAAVQWLGLGGKKTTACMLIGYPNVAYRRTAPRRRADIIWK